MTDRSAGDLLITPAPWAIATTVPRTHVCAVPEHQRRSPRTERSCSLSDGSRTPSATRIAPSADPVSGRAPRRRLLDDSSRAGVWPDSVQVIGGQLSLRLPTG